MATASILLLLAALAAIATRGMIALGVMDHPDGRKAHAKPTPKSGGLAIILVLALAPLFLPALREPPMPALIAIACVLGLAAFLDDLRPVPPLAKLTVQLAAAIAATQFGVLPPGADLPTTLLAILWVTAVTNAVNFMDGMDGLIPGTALIACAAVATLATDPAATLALPLAAAIAGFLPFNCPRARIFLGDAGSQPLGFLLACLALLAPPAETLLVPALLAALLFDTGLTLARRAANGARLTQPHREHLYQTAPLPPRAVTLIHWAFTTWAALCWYTQPGPLLLAALLLLPQLAWLALTRACVRKPA